MALVTGSSNNRWSEEVKESFLAMVFITNEYLFFASVFVISLSGVLMPGPLFAVTIQKANQTQNRRSINRALGTQQLSFH